MGDTVILQPQTIWAIEQGHASPPFRWQIQVNKRQGFNRNICQQFSPITGRSFLP